MTIYDLADQLNVSPTTVSMALNDDKRVAAKTRERVQAYAREVGFQRNEQARNFRLKRSNIIGVVVHNIDCFLWSGVIRAIEEEMGHNYSVVICNSYGAPEKEKIKLEKLLQRKVDGIIIQPTTSGHEHLVEINEKEVPVVLFERDDESNLSYVKGDDFGDAYNITNQCIKAGNDRIALLTFDIDVLGVLDRTAGFEKAISEAGLADKCKVFTARDLSPEAVEQTIAEDIKNYDVVICSEESLALPLSSNAKKWGCDPKELSLVCWSNGYFMNYMPIPITTVYLPTRKMGTIAAKIIKKYIKGDRTPQKTYIPEDVFYRGKLAESYKSENKVSNIEPNTWFGARGRSQLTYPYNGGGQADH